MVSEISLIIPGQEGNLSLHAGGGDNTMAYLSSNQRDVLLNATQLEALACTLLEVAAHMRGDVEFSPRHDKKARSWVYSFQHRLNRARTCECGCGSSIAHMASSACFLNAQHRLRHHREKKQFGQNVSKSGKGK